ncbi:MAG: hypothetical protein U0641_05805 [Anaerolineae bacterium]
MAIEFPGHIVLKKNNGEWYATYKDHLYAFHLTAKGKTREEARAKLISEMMYALRFAEAEGAIGQEVMEEVA